MTTTEPGPVAAPPRSGGRAWPATIAVLAAIAGLLVTQVAIGTAVGQRLDERATDTVVAGRDTQLAVLSLLGYVSIGAIALVTIVSVGLALARGNVRLAVAAVAVVAGANVSTQVLKHVVLDRADLIGGIAAPNSLPSGHTTVVAAGVGALLLTSPGWLRSLLVPAGAFAVGLTGTSTVVAGWHRPSDVIVALAVTLAWTAGAAAWVGGQRRIGVESIVLAIVGSAAALLALVGIGVRPSYGWDGFFDAAVVLAVVSAVVALFTAAVAVTAPDQP